jgi:hypothetical protein
MIKHIWTTLIVFFFLTENQALGHWEQTGGPEGEVVRCIAISGTTVLANDYNGDMYISTNNGVSWSAGNFGISGVLGIKASGNNVFAYTRECLFLSVNNGKSWSKLNTGLDEIREIALNGDTILAVKFRGLSVSMDNGKSWNTVDFQLVEAENFAVIGGTFIAGLHGGIMAFSKDKGKSWTYNDSQQWTSTGSLVVVGRDIFAGTNLGVFRSTNNGVSWIAANTGLATTWVSAIRTIGDTLIACTDSGVFISMNKGKLWTNINYRIPNLIIKDLIVSDHTFLASTDYGVFRSEDNGISWIESNSGLVNSGVMDLAVNGATIFATAGNGGDRLYRSTNNGVSWTVAGNNNLPKNSGLACLTVIDNTLFATPIYFNNTLQKQMYYGVVLSTNNGESWIRSNNDLTDICVNSLAGHGDTLFAGTQENGIFRSTNKGLSWDEINPQLNAIYALAISKGIIIANDIGHGIYVSENNGESWKESGCKSPDHIGGAPDHITVHGNQIFSAGSYSYCAYSPDNGASWHTYPTPLLKEGYPDKGPISINAATFDSSGDNIFIGGFDGIFLSPDKGKSWRAVSNGLRDSSVWTLTLKGDALFVGTDRGVWRRPISEMVSATNAYGKKKIIRQAPFFQSALSHSGSLVTVEFTLSNSDRVAVTMYDLAGRAIACLVNKRLNAGDYKYSWDAYAFARGCYAVKVQAGGATWMKTVQVAH